MKFIAVIVFALSLGNAVAQTAQLSVQVTDKSTAKAIPFAKIKVYVNNALLTSAVSDSTGECKTVNLKPGTVDIVCEAKNYREATVKGIGLLADKISFIPISLKKE